jgi:hypothetical protein
MKKEFTDEQLDKMMRTLICDASADSGEIKDIASSPKVWWAIQREINAQKETSRSPWPPANVIRRWLLIAVPGAAAAGLLLSFVYFRSTPDVDQAAQSAMPVVSTVSTPRVANAVAPGITSVKNIDVPIMVTTDRNNATRQIKLSAAKARIRTHPASALTAATLKKNEIKTDFIALSYARDPESGQIVRVKVPSSMMVSLGVVSSANAGDMVDAEVVVGDDGLTRAIRFIR